MDLNSTNMSKILIIDVETSGLPSKRNCNYKDLDQYASARIVQLSMMLCNESYEEIMLKDFIVRADGFNIDNSHIHGITNEISLSNGVAFAEVADELKDILSDVSCIIAHNADFDINVIKSELYRNGLTSIITDVENKTVVCTMKKTMHMVNAQGRYGVKFPSLAELYLYVFNEPLTNLHNSKYDVINLHKIVKRLYEIKDLQMF
jgi:DNA polymerase III epsilon subunit-like protein